MNKKAWKGIMVMILMAGFILPNPGLLFAENTAQRNSGKDIESVFVTTKTMLNGEETSSLLNRQGVKNDLAQLRAGQDTDIQDIVWTLVLVGCIVYVFTHSSSDKEESNSTEK